MGSMLVLHWSGANDGWYFSVLPWLVQGVALALVVSIVATGRLARWFSVPRVVAWVLIMSTGGDPGRHNDSAGTRTPDSAS
jgi:hypothetical protein